MAAGSSIGTVFRVTTWGESHGTAIGVVADGCPAGIEAMVVLLLFADDVLPENTAREIAKMNCSLKSNVFFIKTP